MLDTAHLKLLLMIITDFRDIEKRPQPKLNSDQKLTGNKPGKISKGKSPIQVKAQKCLT